MTMIRTTASRPRSGSASAFAAARQVARALVAAWTALVNRRQVRRLSELDDYLLADIGLSRADVEDAASLPIYEDPTARLALAARFDAGPTMHPRGRGRPGG